MSEKNLSDVHEGACLGELVVKAEGQIVIFGTPEETRNLDPVERVMLRRMKVAQAMRRSGFKFTS